MQRKKGLARKTFIGGSGSGSLKRTTFQKRRTPLRASGLKKTQKGIKSTQSLQSKLDTIFSLYIRKRYATPDGMVRCVTCGKYDHWKETDAGHYISRQYLSTRYDERNVHVQCKSCNRFHEGMKDEYTLFLLKTYGVGILEELNRDKWKAVYNYPYETKIMLYTTLNHDL